MLIKRKDWEWRTYGVEKESGELEKERIRKREENLRKLIRQTISQSPIFMNQFDIRICVNNEMQACFLLIKNYIAKNKVIEKQGENSTRKFKVLHTYEGVKPF